MTLSKISYRDYLIWQAVDTIECLSAAVGSAMKMNDEGYAIGHLERKIRVARELLNGEPSPVAVAPRPDDRKEDDGEQPQH